MTFENIIIGAFATLTQSIASSFVIFKQIPETEKNSKIKFIIGIWIYLMISLLWIPNQFRFVLFILVMSVFMHFILKINDKKIILYAFNTELILAISEILITLVLVLLGINSKAIVNDVIINLITNVLISALAIIIAFLPFVQRTHNAIVKLFTKNKNLINYLIVFLIVLYIIVSKNGLELILKSNFYVNIIFIIGIAAIIYIVIKSEAKAEQLQEVNTQMVNYVTKYEKIITEQGKANHEFKNQLMVIRGYAQMNNSKKLIDYVDSIIEDSKKAHSSYLISQLNKFPDGGVKGLLYYKLSIMDDEKIKYSIEVETGVKAKLKSLKTNMYKDITKILGVVLDNAIDASRKSKQKNIIIFATQERGKVIFTISNSYKGTIEIDKIGTGYTTKGVGHGFGLRLVNDIINDNENLALINDLDLENKHYVTRLEVKIPSKK